MFEALEMGSANHLARLVKKAIRLVTAFAVALPFMTCLVTPQAKATDLGDGKAHYERGEFQEAILSFDRSIAENSFNPKAFNSRGFTHFRLMKYRLAIADFDRAIALEPTFALAFNNRGRANFSLKRYDLAMSDYSRAIEL